MGIVDIVHNFALHIDGFWMHLLSEISSCLWLWTIYSCIDLCGFNSIKAVTGDKDSPFPVSPELEGARQNSMSYMPFQRIKLYMHCPKKLTRNATPRPLPCFFLLFWTTKSRTREWESERERERERGHWEQNNNNIKKCFIKFQD